MAPICVEVCLGLYLEFQTQYLNPLRPSQDLPGFQEKTGVFEWYVLEKKMLNEKSIRMTVVISRKKIELCLRSQRKLKTNENPVILQCVFPVSCFTLPYVKSSNLLQFCSILRVKIAASICFAPDCSDYLRSSSSQAQCTQNILVMIRTAICCAFFFQTYRAQYVRNFRV